MHAYVIAHFIVAFFPSIAAIFSTVSDTYIPSSVDDVLIYAGPICIGVIVLSFL